VTNIPDVIEIPIGNWLFWTIFTSWKERY